MCIQFTGAQYSSDGGSALGRSNL